MMKDAKHLRSFWNQKNILFVSLLLIFGIAVGVTTAWLTSNDGPLSYEMAGAFVDCEVLETFNGTTKSNVRIKNIGNTDAYIRAVYVANWVNDEGVVHKQRPLSGTDFTLSFGSGWSGYSDTYYYYDTPVAADGVTPVFITSCVSNGTEPEGYHLQVTVLAEAIQALPDTSVVNEAWWSTRNQEQNKPVPAS